jgi:hypothetical protein
MPPAAACRIESAVICQPIEAERGGRAIRRSRDALLVQIQRPTAAQQVIRGERAGELEPCRVPDHEPIAAGRALGVVFQEVIAIGRGGEAQQRDLVAD